MGSGRTGHRAGTNDQLTNNASTLYNKTYVKLKLTDADKDRLRASDWTAEKVLFTLDKMVSDGYKISTQFEGNNDCVGVYATIAEEPHRNFKFCLTARGPDVMKALLSLFYKHYEVLAEDWPTGQQGNAASDGWG